jgi:hypothetical protein
MNLDTVLMCAQMAARMQQSGLGHVDADIQALIDELTAAPAVEPVVAAVVEPVVEAPVVAEEAPVVEAPAEVPAAE